MKKSIFRSLADVYEIQYSDDFWRTFANRLSLPTKGRVSAECPCFKHAGYAGQDRQIRPHQESPAGFGLATRTIGNHEIRFQSKFWQLIQHGIGIRQSHNGDFRQSF